MTDSSAILMLWYNVSHSLFPCVIICLTFFLTICEPGNFNCFNGCATVMIKMLLCISIYLSIHQSICIPGNSGCFCGCATVLTQMFLFKSAMRTVDSILDIGIILNYWNANVKYKEEEKRVDFNTEPQKHPLFWRLSLASAVDYKTMGL